MVTLLSKNFTSVNDMMVYLQRLNPNAINLYNDMKIIANSLIADGKIISTDVEYKTLMRLLLNLKKHLIKQLVKRRKKIIVLVIISILLILKIVKYILKSVS